MACQRHIPSLEGLHTKYKNQGLVVLAVCQEKVDVVKKAIEKERISYPVALDKSQATSKQFPNSNASVSYLIDPSGNVIWAGRVHELNEDALKAGLAGAKPSLLLKKTQDRPGDSAARTPTETKPSGPEKKPAAQPTGPTELLTLKDGTKVRGRTVSRSADKIYFKGEDGKAKFYNQDQIQSLQKIENPGE